MAQAVVLNEPTVEEMLTLLLKKPGVKEYTVFNNDGIPLKWSSKIEYKRAVHYATLYSDLWNAASKVVQNGLKYPDGKTDTKNVDNSLEYIRLRTKEQTEIIVAVDSKYTLVCVQYCGPKIEEVKSDAPAEVKKEGAGDDKKK